MATPKASAKPKTVAAYIADDDPAARAKLRQTIRAATPKAVESLKWGSVPHTNERIVMI